MRKFRMYITLGVIL